MPPPDSVSTFMSAMLNMGTRLRRSGLRPCTSSNGVVGVFLLRWYVGMAVLLTSTARLTPNHQKVEGRSADVSQFRVILIICFHRFSTSPFCDWRRGGADLIGMYSDVIKSLHFPPMILLSKSVRISLTFVRPTFVMNCCIAVCICLSVVSLKTWDSLVALSTKSIQYLAPPIARDGPNPMSVCQTSLY